VERLRQLCASRSQSAVAERLTALGQAARGGDNLMPVIFEAADAHATVGDISDRLRGVFGEYHEG
jgi:methylmalonyl-CoA mutase N-terminal domain/subunit